MAVKVIAALVCRLPARSDGLAVQLGHPAGPEKT